MAFDARIKTINKGGNVKVEDDKIMVRNADEVIFILCAATSYNGFDIDPAMEGVDLANGINPNPLFNFIHPEKPVIKDRSLLGEISISKSDAIDFKTNAGHQYVIVTT